VLQLHTSLQHSYATHKNEIQLKLNSLKANCALVLEKTKEVLEQGQVQINGNNLEPIKAINGKNLEPV
jgi:hypothetical protein